MTEIHDFVNEMTFNAGIEDLILVCGDFNIFMQPVSDKVEQIIRKSNSWEKQQKQLPEISEQLATLNCDDVVSLLNREYALAKEVLSKGAEGVLLADVS
jgi:hypothetical protein